MVHPNQELAVIAGQGTIALEVLEEVRETHGLAQGSAPRRQECHKKGVRSARSTHSRFLSTQAPKVNAVVVPVGGGGMIAGIAVAIKVGNSSSGQRWLHLPVGRAGLPKTGSSWGSLRAPGGCRACLAPCAHSNTAPFKLSLSAGFETRCESVRCRAVQRR